VTGLALAAIAVLVLVNGFFVAAEFALVSSRPQRLQGDSLGVRLTRRQLAKLDEYLSACQLGITIASLALGALGEPTIAHLIEPALESAALSHAVAGVVATVLAILVMTALHITAGEQAPKSFAIGSGERVARVCAVPLELFYRSLKPLVMVLNAASNGLVRLFGGTPASSHAQQASLEELRQLIGGLTAGGELDADEAQILQGVFTLDERRAFDVMTPQTRITAVYSGQTVREALEAVRGAGHSRWPLLDVNRAPLGVVRGRVLTDALLDGRDDERVERFAHEAIVVPGTVKLDDLLTRMRNGRSSLSIVVDEYGLAEGVVTVEDILEEIVGEIWDEDDLSDETIRVLPDGKVVCRGDVSLLDLAAHGIDLPARENTLAGLLHRLLRRSPRVGERIMVGDVEVRIIAVGGGQLLRALLVPAAREGPERAPTQNVVDAARRDRLPPTAG
jgi:CBS domain containing-hemolysin-like protein